MAIIRNEPIDVYHANPAESNTSLKELIENGPLWYKRRYIDRAIPGKSTKALREGSAFDTMVTEPDKYSQIYVMQPATYVCETKGPDFGKEKPWNNNAKVCDRWMEETAAAGQIVVTAADHERYVVMREKLLAHPLAAELIAAAEKQVSFRHHMAAWGFDLQARPDFFCAKPVSFSRGRPCTGDLKKTAIFKDLWNQQDPTHPRNGSAIADYGYHRQGAIDTTLAALDGVDDPLHFLIVVEDCEPFRVAVIEVPDSYLEIGWNEVERAGAQLAACLRTNVWPGSPMDVCTVQPPRWMVEREESIARRTSAAAMGGAA